jgi:hypothetical protein
MPITKYTQVILIKNSVDSNCIEAILMDQNPGSSPNNNSVQLLTNSAAIGAIKIIPDNFITTKPSILLFAKELTSSAKIGACKGVKIRMNRISLKFETSRKPVVIISKKVVIKPNR